jgi:hypothetical protein
MAEPVPGRSQEIESKAETTIVRAKDHGDRSSASTVGDGDPEIVGDDGETSVSRSRKREWFAYVKTKQFWLVLVFGYV